MKIALAATAALLWAGLSLPASAHNHERGVAAEPAAAWAQARCVVRRERIRRPGGGVVVRTVRDCRPARVDRCRVERQRVVRPNGRVIVRTVRTCR